MITDYILLAAVIWLAVINITAFAVYGADKSRAIRHQWRISEAALIGLALAGGSVGAYAGMKIFHHKTRHAKFRFGVPVIFFMQLVIIVLAVIYSAPLY